MNDVGRIILPGQPPMMNNTNRLQQENMYLKQAFFDLQRSHDGLLLFLIILLRREENKEIEFSKLEANAHINVKEFFIHSKKLEKGRMLLKLEHITDPTERKDDGMAQAGSEGNAVEPDAEGSGEDS